MKQLFRLAAIVFALAVGADNAPIAFAESCDSTSCYSEASDFCETYTNNCPVAYSYCQGPDCYYACECGGGGGGGCSVEECTPNGEDVCCWGGCDDGGMCQPPV